MSKYIKNTQKFDNKTIIFDKTVFLCNFFFYNRVDACDKYSVYQKVMGKNHYLGFLI